MWNILSSDYCYGIFGDGRGISAEIGDLVHYLYIGIKIVVPILLVIFAILDLGKAITAKKEDDIKRYQNSCLRRIITGVLVFLVIFVVEFMLGFFEPESGTSSESPVKCAMEIIRGKGNGPSNITSR